GIRDYKVTGVQTCALPIFRPVGGYIAMLVSDGRMAEGRKRAAQFADTLTAIEQKFGVDRLLLLAIWGIESNYGSEPEGKDVIRRSEERRVGKECGAGWTRE